MSVQAAKAHLEKWGLLDGFRELEASSATVELAAQAIGCDPAHIAKSLTFQTADGGAMLIVAAGDGRVDNRKFKDAFGFKAKMLSAEDVERLIGHAVGGVCPFGIQEGVAVYTDVSLQRFDTVYPAAGSSHSVAQMSPQQLFDCSGSLRWVDVCKDVTA